MKKRILALVIGMVALLGGCAKNETVIINDEEKKSLLNFTVKPSNDEVFSPLGYSRGEIFGVKGGMNPASYGFDFSENVYSMNNLGETKETVKKVPSGYQTFASQNVLIGDKIFSEKGYYDWVNNREEVVIKDEILERVEKMEGEVIFNDNRLTPVVNNEDFYFYRSTGGVGNEVKTFYGIIDGKNNTVALSKMEEYKEVEEDGFNNTPYFGYLNIFYNNEDNSFYKVDYVGEVSKLKIVDGEISEEKVVKLPLSENEYVDNIYTGEDGVYFGISQQREMSQEKVYKVDFKSREVSTAFTGGEAENISSINGSHEYFLLNRFEEGLGVYSLATFKDGKVDIVKKDIMRDDKDVFISPQIFINKNESKFLVQEVAMYKNTTGGVHSMTEAVRDISYKVMELN